MDPTLQFMLPLWIENAAHNQGHLKDLMEIPLPADRGITGVIIEGTGPSFPRMIPDQMLVVGNQSSAGDRTDLVVVTDAQLAAARKLHQRRLVPMYGKRDFPMQLAMATLAHPACRTKFPEAYGFVHVLHNAVEDPTVALVNRMLEESRGPVEQFLLQVGCSMNAAALVVLHLMKNGRLPKVPIWFAGVDFAFEFPGDIPKALRDQVVMSSTGKLTTPQFLRYARELHQIVEGHPDYQFRCAPAPWNLVSEFIDEWVLS